MTNETSKPTDEMKDVAAGNIPHPVEHATGTADADALKDVVAGNIPHPVEHSSPQSQPGDPSLNLPGTTIEVADLSGAAAGVNATPDVSGGGGDPISDPPYNPNPGRQDSSSSPG